MTFKTSISECGREPFTIEWDDFFSTHSLDVETDVITSSTWTLTGASELSSSIDGTDTTVFLEHSLSAGDVITALNTIEINGGTYRDCRQINIEVF